MNFKTTPKSGILAFTAGISRIAQCICLIGACSFAHADNVNFSGQLSHIGEDIGGAVYSGVEIGTVFSGSINDETLNGFITDGATRTSFGCCASEEAGPTVTNNFVVSADDAAFVNAVTGTTDFVAGDTVDLIELEGVSDTSGGGYIYFTLIFIFDPLTFSNDNPGNYPQDPDDAITNLFIIDEESSLEMDIYDAAGVAENISFTDASFVTFDDHAINVAPSGIDDTANIQFALDTAASEGYPVVRLSAGTYFISSLFVENFKGTLEGLAKVSTIVEILDNSIDCAGMEQAGLTSSVIKFAGGEPRIRFMTIRANRPCMGEDQIQSVLHFTGMSTMSANCANDVIFGAVDRINLEGTANTFLTPTRAVLASAEGNQLDGCKQNLLGTFKLNRSDVSGFFTGLQTTMKAGAQVDVNFNLFVDNQNAVWLLNTNQNTTITNNDISAVDVSESPNKGIIIHTQIPTAPNATRVVINNNEFTLSSSSGVMSYAVEGKQPGRVANVSAVISNNKFNLGGSQTRGVSLSDISNVHVSANRFTGDGETAIYASGTGSVSGWTVTANKNLGNFNSISSDIFLDQQTSECIVGASQGAIVNDSGTDNTVLTQF